MSTFFAQLSLVLWFTGMFAFWIEHAVNRLSVLPLDHWQIHLCFVVGIVVLTNLIFLTQSLYLVFPLPAFEAILKLLH